MACLLFLKKCLFAYVTKKNKREAERDNESDSIRLATYAVGSQRAERLGI